MTEKVDMQELAKSLCGFKQTTLKDYGYSISDNQGELRNISEIIAELKDYHSNFSTHAMSDHVLFLKGEKEMLGKIIEYLERV